MAPIKGAFTMANPAYMWLKGGGEAAIKSCLKIEQMHLKISINSIMRVLRCNMKRAQQVLLPSELSRQLSDLGYGLAQSRLARKIPQSEAAVRANISRNTVSRIENGDPGVAIGQILRYLDVVRPGATHADVMKKEDKAVQAVESLRRPRRARPLSEKELDEYDF